MEAIRAEDFGQYLKEHQRKSLEAEMALVLRVLGQERPYLPEPEREYLFHPHRQWRFDFAYSNGYMVAVEVEGGIWQQTKTGRSKGHAHPVRFEQDIEKYNEATRLGWRVFRFTTKWIRSGDALDFLLGVFPPF